jgi:hypothetical protein
MYPGLAVTLNDKVSPFRKLNVAGNSCGVKVILAPLFWFVTNTEAMPTPALTVNDNTAGVGVGAIVGVGVGFTTGLDPLFAATATTMNPMRIKDKTIR